MFLKKLLLCAAVLWCTAALCAAQERSLSEVFPQFDEGQRAAVLSKDGLLFSRKASSLHVTLPVAGFADVFPSDRETYLIEKVLVAPGRASMLQVYNALQNIRGLQGRVYRSASRGAEVPLFEEVERVTSERNNTPLPDPPRASVVPRFETVYARLKDANFGNCYYRLDIKSTDKGLLCTLTNIKALKYLFVTVIKQERFIARIYLEPIKEGLLMYGATSADVGNFLSSLVHVPSAIQKRIAIIEQWALDGIF